MTLERFPTLRGLLDDLTRLTVEEVTRRNAVREQQQQKQQQSASIVGEGRDVTTVHAPWLGRSYHLTGAQREVVRQLLHAHLECRNPDVDERTLLSLAGLPPTSKLADAFKGSSAWGELIVKGKGAATYRLAGPDAAEEEEDKEEEDKEEEDEGEL